jgi:hypothetical protein
MPVALGGLWFLGFGILGLLVLGLWIAGLVDLSTRKDLDRRTRYAWILIIVLLPLVGTLIYLARRPRLPDERDKIAAAQMRRH